MDTIRGTAAAILTGLAATLVVVALAILPLLTPAWVGFAQGRAEAAAWTGFTPEQLRTVTDAILADLVLGPPAFDVALDGRPVLTEAERSHMRDVRGVFVGVFAVAAAAGLALVALFLATRGAEARLRFWRRLARTGLGTVAITAVGGVLGLVLFDTAFDLFHRVFFPGGNWMFDPRTDRLVQLFPQAFWVDSTIAAGAGIVVLGGLLWLAAGRRARALAPRAELASSLRSRPAGMR